MQASSPGLGYILIYVGQSYGSVGHQYSWIGQTINLRMSRMSSRTECPVVSSLRRTISQMGRTMSVTDGYFKKSLAGTRDQASGRGGGGLDSLKLVRECIL